MANASKQVDKLKELMDSTPEDATFYALDQLIKEQREIDPALKAQRLDIGFNKEGQKFISAMQLRAAQGANVAKQFNWSSKQQPIPQSLDQQLREARSTVDRLFQENKILQTKFADVVDRLRKVEADNERLRRELEIARDESFYMEPLGTKEDAEIEEDFVQIDPHRDGETGLQMMMREHSRLAAKFSKIEFINEQGMQILQAKQKGQL